MSLDKRIRQALFIDALFFVIPVGIVATSLYLIRTLLRSIPMPDYVMGLVFISVMLPLIIVGYPLIPLVHKNASIGMRSMGFAIVNKEGYRPPIKIILMRQLFLYRTIKFSRGFKLFLMTLSEICEELEYFGTKIACVGDYSDASEKEAKHNRENEYTGSHIQYLKPFSKKSDYDSYTTPVVKTVIASLIYVFTIVLCLVVFFALNDSDIPLVKDLIFALSALIMYFDTIFLMSSIGYILYVSEKKKCLNEAGESANGEQSDGA